MEKLNQLASACKSIEVSINKHKSLRISVSQYVNDPDLEKVSTFKKMVELDTVVKIEIHGKSFFDTTTIWDYDLDNAIKQAVGICLS